MSIFCQFFIVSCISVFVYQLSRARNFASLLNIDYLDIEVDFIAQQKTYQNFDFLCHGKI